MRPYELNPPEDLASYIIQTVADTTYLIFDKKKDFCRCTRCGALHKPSEMANGAYLKHNQKTFCYDCRTEAIAKESRYGRKNITEYGRILWFKKEGPTTFAQLDEYQISYSGWEPKVSLWPSAQYRFEKGSQRYFKHVPMGFWTPEHWEERKTVRIPSAATGMRNGYNVPKYQKTVAHPSCRTNIGTDLKYANMDMSHLHKGSLYESPWKDDPYDIIGYIYQFLKYPSIEILEKAGFEKIVLGRIRGRTCKDINWQAKELKKILKLTPAEIKKFRENKKAGIYELERYQELKKAGYPVSFEHLDILSKYKWEHEVEEATKIAKFEKIRNYLILQKSTFRIYLDYIGECKQLGYDMKKKQVLFPKSLQASHEETSKKIEIQANEEKREAFETSMKEIYGQGEYREEHFLIRPAKGPEELAAESAALHHCVRTYTDKVTRGSCAILFIRKTEEPDKPFFTLELSPEGEIVQCRGEHNQGYPETVGQFIKHWETWMEKQKKKERNAA